MSVKASKPWPPSLRLALLLLPVAYLIAIFIVAGVSTIPVFSYSGWLISARGAWRSSAVGATSPWFYTLPVQMHGLGSQIPILLFLHFIVGLVLAVFLVFNLWYGTGISSGMNQRSIWKLAFLVGAMRWVTVVFWVVALVPILLDIVVLGENKVKGAALMPTGPGWALVVGGPLVLLVWAVGIFAPWQGKT